MLYPYTRDYIIVPTPVGVNRARSQTSPQRQYCPHARGGEPMAVIDGAWNTGLSPRPWG